MSSFTADWLPSSTHPRCAALTRARRRALAVAAPLLLLGLAACASTPTDTPPPPKPTLTVINASNDPWEILAVGAVRGTVGPRSELVVRNLPTGDLVIVARNQRLRLRQETSITLRPDDAGRWAIATPAAQLRVINERATGCEVVIDGHPFGWARPLAETNFDGVPAGLRVLIAKCSTGGGAAQLEQFLAPGDETVWTVTANPGPPGAPPHPPAGQGLIWVRNAGKVAIRVLIGGMERASVPPGERATIVLPPGTWELVVEMEGIAAQTHHSVTLLPNQSADWTWGE